MINIIKDNRLRVSFANEFKDGYLDTRLLTYIDASGNDTVEVYSPNNANYLCIYYYKSSVCKHSETEHFESLCITEYTNVYTSIDSTVREKLDKLIKLLTDKNIINSNDI